ncbi:MAG: hypothetical protein RI885_966, partial [Actinomycetota bacterium]
MAESDRPRDLARLRRIVTMGIALGLAGASSVAVSSVAVSSVASSSVASSPRAAEPHWQTITATSADDFVDSVGVNVHM